MDVLMMCTMFIIMITVTRTGGLRCYHYNSDVGGLPTASNIRTCQPEVTACETTLIKSGITTRRRHNCAFGPTCDTVAVQTNSSYLHVQTCCHNDLCNNGTDPVFNDSKKYCYSATCREENCLPGLLSRIDNERLGAFCDANGSNCQIQKRKVLQSDGTWETRDWSGCAAPRQCVPNVADLKDETRKITCCNDSFCNGVNETEEMFIDPLKKYCYKYECFSDSPGFCHLGVLDDAVKQGQADVCPMTEKGCFYIDYYTNTKAEHGFVTGCFTEGFLNEISCTAKISKDTNFTSVWQCCDSDRCNSMIAEDSSQNTNQCYSLSCAGEGCLKAAIRAGNYLLCNRSEYGCEAGLLKTAVDSVYTIGCSNTSCTKGHVKPDGRTLIGCCDEDLCMPVMAVSSGPSLESSWNLMFSTCLFLIVTFTAI